MRLHALASLALLLCSCWSSDREQAPVVTAPSTPSSSSSWSRSSYSSPAPDPGIFEAQLHGDVAVPPDRALVSLEATVQATTRAAALEHINAMAGALREHGESAEGCAISTHTFSAVRGGGEAFSASVTLRLDVDLRGLASPADRHARIESCVAPFHALPEDGFEGLRLSLGEPRVTIDDPSAHRERLLERRFAELRAVAGVMDAPPQFHAAALRCTSSGQVTITQRSLSGVHLAVDFTCAPRYAEAPERAEAPSPGAL